MKNASVVHVVTSELERFLVVAEQYHRETGQQAVMPACPVDSEWHRLIGLPDEYQALCLRAVNRDVKHLPMKGTGEIAWTPVYEQLFGRLPEVWFQGPDGTLNEASWLRYLQTGRFYASWDCVPN